MFSPLFAAACVLVERGGGARRYHAVDKNSDIC
jgi:hypothetical protein